MAAIMKNKKPDKNTCIEKALQANFQNRPVPRIPDGWRKNLADKIAIGDLQEQLQEEEIFIKYENRFWRLAWFSFAASIFIFVSLIYFSGQHEMPLKYAISEQICKCLSPENELQ
jgi:hypothetical protein